MSGSAKVTWLRVAALALLGLIGLAFDARPAQAGGCHAAERPVLGLTRPGELLVGPPAASAPRPARVAPRPCSGETPGGLERANPAGLVALRAVGVDLPPPPSHPLPIDPPAARPIQRPDGPDRPPRLAPPGR